MRIAAHVSKRLAAIAFGMAAAYAVALALADAYREGQIVGVLLGLAVPPLVLFFLYEGSEKRAVASIGALLVSAVLLDVIPLLGVPRADVNLVLTAIAAMAIPVATDLLFIDMGMRLRIDPPSARVVPATFIIALVPLAAWMLLNAHKTIVTEDANLIVEIASRITPSEDSLVVDWLDAKLRDQAQRRLAIRTSGGRTYRLSDADVESVREVRTIRKERNPKDGATETQVTKEQEDRMRLILKLQGTAIPDDVVLFSHRGPRTIAETTVTIHKPVVTAEDTPG